MSRRELRERVSETLREHILLALSTRLVVADAVIETVTSYESEGAVTLWRCTKCGKWSHAKRKPKFHQRFVVSPGLGDVIISHETGDMYEDGGYFIQCGPFEEWAAKQVGGGDQ